MLETLKKDVSLQSKILRRPVKPGIGTVAPEAGDEVERWSESKGLRFRGNANNGNCSPRNWNGNNSAANTNSNNGGSAQTWI